MRWQSGDYFEASLGIIDDVTEVRSIAHGLTITAGNRPRLFRAFIKCLVIDRDYAVGDYVVYDAGITGNGMACWANDTYIGVSWYSSPNLINKDGTSVGSIDIGATPDWEVFVQCWK